MPRCPDCDERVSPGAKECPSCGASLTGKSSVKTAAKGLSAGLILACVLGACCLGGGVVGLAVGLPAVQQARNAARMSEAKYNLKQIGIGLHNYHDAFKTFPPGGIHTPDGKPYHAWMAQMLPYVDQRSLYNSINFRVPYTDPGNRAAFSTPVPIYLYPGTPLGTDASGYAVAHYAANSQVFQGKSGVMRLSDFTDGVANTILTGSVTQGFVAWGGVDNMRDPVAGLGDTPSQFNSSATGRTLFLMGDGTVRIVSADVNPALLKALATPDGREDPRQFE